jgi:hypothetical protein
MRTIHLLLGFAMLLALAAAGCSTSDTTGSGGDEILASETIGTDGGTIAVAGEFSLDVPSGAVDLPVEFTVERNASPGAEPTGYDYASDVYRFSPDGQTFLTPVSLTLDYDPADLGAAPEDSVRVWCRATGGDWTPLASTPDPGNDQVVCAVTHFTDFAAMAPESDLPGDGVFCVLSVDKGFMYIPGDPGAAMVADAVSARFDGDVAPCVPSDPLQVDAVACNAWELDWVAEEHRYVHTGGYMEEIIVPGEDYTFTVDGGATAPDLEETITFPDDTPYMTYPNMSSVCDLSGFTVLWEGDGAGTVTLSLLATGGEVFVEVPNSGSHTFTAGDLSQLSAGSATLVMNHFDQRYIVAAGYHPESFIVAKVTSMASFQLQ